MKKQLQHIAFALSFLILLLFVIILINQTVSIVSLAKSVNPLFADVLLFVLLTLYAAITISPFIIYLKMPAKLRPPENEDSPEYDIYIEKLKKRLAGNKHLVGSDIRMETQAEIQFAVSLLNAKADDLTKSTASTVFISTAISQNGRLDALMVLIAQIRLIWESANIYNQRPSIREIISIYANVAATALIIDSIEELDIEEQIEPIITPLISGSVFGGIPGASGLATFLTTSIIDGAANALLTLRVGVITRKHFECHSSGDTKKIRRSASLEAGSMLGDIVFKSAGYVTEAIINASKKRVGIMGGSLKDVAVKSAGTMSDATKSSAHAIIGLIKRSKK